MAFALLPYSSGTLQDLFLVWKLNAETSTWFWTVCIKCIISCRVNTDLKRTSNLFFHPLQKSPKNYLATSPCLNTCGDIVEICIVFECFNLKIHSCFELKSVILWLLFVPVLFSGETLSTKTCFWALVKQCIWWQS